jgi:hypothetical protein
MLKFCLSVSFSCVCEGRGMAKYLVPEAYLCKDSTSQVGLFLLYKQARM